METGEKMQQRAPSGCARAIGQTLGLLLSPEYSVPINGEKKKKGKKEQQQRTANAYSTRRWLRVNLSRVRQGAVHLCKDPDAQAHWVFLILGFAVK